MISSPEDSIPDAPMGIEVGPTPLANSPGYKPPNDPEADAVQRGRREVGKIDIPFQGGEPSAEDLAKAILAALRNDDRRALQELRVTGREYEEILWPEFPQSRPITNLKASDAWLMHERTCAAGISSGLSQVSGKDLLLDRIVYEVGRARYTNFNLYHGVRIHAHTVDGEEIVLKFADSFAERNGVWKVYIYKD